MARRRVPSPVVLTPRGYGKSNGTATKWLVGTNGHKLLARGCDLLVRLRASGWHADR